MHNPSIDTTASKPRIIATKTPKEFKGPEELQLWLAKKKAQIAPLESIPTDWYDPLTKQEHGFLSVSCEAFGRFVRCAKDRIRQFGFEKPLPAGQYVLLKLS